MTEFVQGQCVRACVRPCHCSDCAGKDAPDHPPVPALADKGYLCQKCWSRLWSWLTEIEDLYATLDTRKSDVVEQGESRHQKISGSPALIRLDVMTLTDPRTNPIGYVGEHGFVQQDGPMYIPGEVIGWGRCIADDLGIEGTVETMSQALSLLQHHFEDVCGAPWIDEMWPQIKKIRALLGNAHGEKRPKMVGRCLSVHEVDGVVVPCEQVLYLPDGGQQMRCRRCGRVYVGMDMVRVEIQAGLEKGKVGA